MSVCVYVSDAVMTQELWPGQLCCERCDWNVVVGE